MKSIRPVLVSISWFGFRPTLDFRLVATSARWALTSPPVPGTLTSVRLSAPLTSFGVHSGCSSSSSATTPDTTAEDIEVPPIVK